VKSIICVNSGYISECTIPFCHDGQMSHRFYVVAFSSCFFLHQWTLTMERSGHLDWFQVYVCMPMEESKFFLFFFDTHINVDKRRERKREENFKHFSFFLLSSIHVRSLSLLMRSIMGCVYICKMQQPVKKKKKKKKKNNTFFLKNKGDIKKKSCYLRFSHTKKNVDESQRKTTCWNIQVKS
jgi:hypothetical protein